MTRERHSPWRVAAAIGGAIWVAIYILLLTVAPEWVAHFLSLQQIAALSGVLMLTALLASVAAVEFARRYVVPNLPWTNQGHLAAVVLGWLPFAILTIGYWWLKCGSIK